MTEINEMHIPSTIEMCVTRKRCGSSLRSSYQKKVKSNKDVLLDSIRKLTGFELLQLKDEIIRTFNEVIDREENFFLRDYIDNFFYIVSYNDGSIHRFYTGARAFKEYSNSPDSIAITRYTKDLFPIYQTMMSKQEGFAYIPKDNRKEKPMSKKDYDIKYQKDHIKRIYLVLNKETDKDIIDYLAKQENVNGCLKSLIREQMKKRG